MSLAAATRPAPIPQPEPGQTAETLIARAAAMQPALREAQAEHERLGTYSAEWHERFRQAGFYRIMQPRLFGGYELQPAVYYKVMLEIARGDPSTAWCLALAGSHGFVLASHWPEQAQSELFGPAGEFAAPHRAAPMGGATRVEGGYRVKGRWNYCSGIPHATHFMGTALLDDPEAVPRTVLFLAPRSAYRILDDWGGEQTLGMRASGSNSVELGETIVPAHHVVPVDALFARPTNGTGMENGTPGTRLHGNPMYLGRLMGPYHATLVAIICGAAWAAVDEYERVTRNTPTYVDANVLRADHHEFQRPLGLAMAKAEAAEAILMAGAQRYLALCERWARTGAPFEVEDSLRLWTMLQQGGALASEAVELLFHAAGAFATRQGNRLQRYFRDVQMYRTHSSAQREEFATYLARRHLGRPTGFRGL
jgi:3-hydroxy-9,10-secoandrosta-1,3,5(10)-triene-9,17-dione monooxygenase